MTKMKKHHQTMQILEHTDEKYGSYYTKNTVYINLNRYESDGSGKTHRQYYGITKDEKIEPKLKSMAGSMFHEFCHALHDISGTMISSNKICISEELQEVWEDDEELRTITCFEHDPICDHCFDFVQSILKSKPFLPRSSHNLGYRSRKPLDDAENREKLLQHFLKYKILLEGWREYTL
jgi:hypothetical protein